MEKVFKIIWNWKLTLESCKFSFRSFPTSPAIQRLHLRYPLFRNHVILQSNQVIVNVTSRSSAQHAIINLTTSTHCSIDMEFNHIPESFCVMSIHHARRADVTPSSDFNRRSYRAGFPAASEINKLSQITKLLSVHLWLQRGIISKWPIALLLFCRLLRSTFKRAAHYSRQSFRGDIQFLSTSETTDCLSNQNPWQLFYDWIIELKLLTLQKKRTKNFSRFLVWQSLWYIYIYICISLNKDRRILADVKRLPTSI